MGAWGSGALENDTAQDFIESLKRARKAARIGKLGDVLRGYVQFEQRRRTGANVSAPTPEEIAVLRRDLQRVRDYYTQPGQKLPLVIMPWLASAEAEQAYVIEMTKPRVEDGMQLASQALAACTLLAAALDRLGNVDDARCLRACERESLIALLPQARECLRVVPDNDAFMASWEPNAEKIRAQIEVVETALR